MPIDAPARRLEANGPALAHRVYDLLAQAILDGRLAPGERVRDVDLAAQLGISRTPVREAMQRLQRQGMIEVARHRYTRVAAHDESTTAETVEFVGLLAGAGLRVGVERMSEADLAACTTLIDELIDASERDDVAAVRTGSARFYEQVSRAAQNRLYTAVLSELGTPLRRFLADWVPLRGEPALRTQNYRRLREAVAVRDGRIAETIVREQHGLA